jgi:hypothetical protein
VVFALLLGQTPGQDRTFDKVVFSLTALVATASLVVGRFRRRAGQWRSGPVSTVILSAELLLCLYALASLWAYQRY